MEQVITVNVSEYPDSPGIWLVKLKNGEVSAIRCTMWDCDDGKERLEWDDYDDGVVMSDGLQDFDGYWGKPVKSIKLPDGFLEGDVLT